MMRDITFEQFWNLYGLKVGRKKAERRWAGMTKTARLAAYNGIKRMREYYHAKGYNLPLPLTYLNGERWEDEYPEEEVESPQAVHGTADPYEIADIEVW